MKDTHTKCFIIYKRGKGFRFFFTNYFEKYNTNYFYLFLNTKPASCHKGLISFSNSVIKIICFRTTQVKTLVFNLTF